MRAKAINDQGQHQEQQASAEVGEFIGGCEGCGEAISWNRIVVKAYRQHDFEAPYKFKIAYNIRKVSDLVPNIFSRADRHVRR